MSETTTKLKEQQTILFKQKFQEYLNQGYDKSTAAAEALKDAFKLTSTLNNFNESSLSSSSPSTISTNITPHLIPVPASRPVIPIKISYDIMFQLVQQCSASGSFTPILRLINEVFSSPTLLSVCFGLNQKCSDDMEIVNDNNYNNYNNNNIIQLNIPEVQQVYSLILSCGHEGVKNSIIYAFLTLTSDMQIHSKTYHTDLILLKLYFIVLLHPSILENEFQPILKSLFDSLNNITPQSHEVIHSYIQTWDSKTFLHFLKIFRQYIIGRMNQSSIKDARIGVKCLDMLHTAYQKQSNLQVEISLSEFYISNISEYLLIPETRRKEYQLWLHDLGTTNTTSYIPPTHGVDRHTLQSFISFPYILTPGIKASIIELDAAVQMRQGMHQEYEEAVASGSQFMSPYLVLRIRRSHIVSDTVNHFVAISENDYKKPLKVIFDSEEGVDAGGVRKEFYQIMMKELLDPNYGMFKYYPESHLLWFNSDSFESEAEFELIGILLGIAIYNSIIVDFRMPKVIYKKLKGEQTTLQDLAELQPDLAKGLEKLLTFNGDVQSTFQFNFQISYESLGEIHTINLKDDGANIMVTNENREEYVALYVDYILNTSVLNQFQAFHRGFGRVCGGAALDLFTSSELELLICGNPVLDFHELQRGTRYEDGYDGSETIIQQFWEVLHSFDEVDKRKFLKFISASDRSPIDGLAQMNFVISKNGNDDTRLPSAHTCFNHMLLPQYSTKEILEQKLRYCIQEAEGFGLR